MSVVVEYGSLRDTVSVRKVLSAPAGRGSDTWVSVGYELVSSGNVMVPDNELSYDCIGGLCSGVFSGRERFIEGGVPFCITKYNAGLFVNQAGYDGAFTGGVVPVYSRLSLPVLNGGWDVVLKPLESSKLVCEYEGIFIFEGGGYVLKRGEE